MGKITIQQREESVYKVTIGDTQLAGFSRSLGGAFEDILSHLAHDPAHETGIPAFTIEFTPAKGKTNDGA